jgi:colanic acid/amylovoran biosynthesis glycosyltransferase
VLGGILRCLLEDVTLVIVSPLAGFLRSSGKIVLTQKFVDGVGLFRELWKGPILHLCQPASQPSDNLDNVEVAAQTSAFDTYCESLSEERLRAIVPKRSVVLASVGERFNSLSRLCREIGIPCVYVTEYSLKTRKQIAREYQRSDLHGIWAKLRQTQQEIAQRSAISAASAVQCNGLPTYSAYKGINPRSHLFFDSRIEPSMLTTDDQISQRLAQLHHDRKLRLVFSGRLNLTKGVDDLPIVAKHLRRLNIPFEMSICGEGQYLDQLRKDIEHRELGQLVRLRGTLDFKEELIPFVSGQTDLFVCCHRQGDPSCTYVETMACGVPIVGYANEAWEQLSSFAKTGWVTPLGDPEALANRIAQLSRDHKEIERSARASLAFARDHTFEKTFRRRVEHLDGVASSVFRQA